MTYPSIRSTPDHLPGGGWIFSQNVSSLALLVWQWQCLEDPEQKDQQINYSMSQLRGNKGVYRTAPATPGVFKNKLQQSWRRILAFIWLSIPLFICFLGLFTFYFLPFPQNRHLFTCLSVYHFTILPFYLLTFTFTFFSFFFLLPFPFTFYLVGSLKNLV